MEKLSISRVHGSDDHRTTTDYRDHRDVVQSQGLIVGERDQVADPRYFHIEKKDHAEIHDRLQADLRDDQTLETIEEQDRLTVVITQDHLHLERIILHVANIEEDRLAPHHQKVTAVAIPQLKFHREKDLNRKAPTHRFVGSPYRMSRISINMEVKSQRNHTRHKGTTTFILRRASLLLIQKLPSLRDRLLKSISRRSQ